MFLKMMFTNLLCLTFLVGVPSFFAHAAAVTRDVASESAADNTTASDSHGMPHPIEVLTINGVAAGEKFSLNGTINEVFKQLEVIHPGVDLLADGVVVAANATGSAASTVPSVVKRTDGMFCIPVNGQDWNTAKSYEVYEGIDMLRRIEGTLGVNPTSCVRLWCKGKSSIWICNDNGHRIDPRSHHLAGMADQIMWDCAYRPPSLPFFWAGGQYFDDNGRSRYNVIVRQYDC